MFGVCVRCAMKQNKSAGEKKLYILLLSFFASLSICRFSVSVLCHSLECGQIWDNSQTFRLILLATMVPMFTTWLLFYPWACCLGNVAKEGVGKQDAPCWFGDKVADLSFSPCVSLYRPYFASRSFSLHSTLALAECVKTLKLQLSPRATCWIHTAPNKAPRSKTVYLLQLVVSTPLGFN